MTTNESHALSKLRQLRVLPVLVVPEVAHAAPLARALVAGGLPIAEITLRTPAALDSIRAISNANANILVGAGTVLTVDQARAAIDAGATFIVSPGLNPAVVEFCLSQAVQVFPGVITPTEIETAWRLGLRVVKFFPAEPAGGLAFLKAVMQPYSDMEFIPTGGLTRAHLHDYLTTPRIVACGGSWMAAAKWLTQNQFDYITTETAATMIALAQIPTS